MQAALRRADLRWLWLGWEGADTAMSPGRHERLRAPQRSTQARHMADTGSVSAAQSTGMVSAFCFGQIFGTYQAETVAGWTVGEIVFLIVVRAPAGGPSPASGGMWPISWYSSPTSTRPGGAVQCTLYLKECDTRCI